MKAGRPEIVLEHIFSQKTFKECSYRPILMLIGLYITIIEAIKLLMIQRLEIKPKIFPQKKDLYYEY